MYSKRTAAQGLALLSINGDVKVDNRKYLPEEWKDVKTMAFLFREFKPKDANPEGWETKLRFWISSVKRWSKVTNSVEFSVRDVQEAFRKEDSFPEMSCIKLVLSNMLRKGDLIAASDFVANCHQSGSGWVSWGVNLAAKPLSWGWSMLGAAKSDPEEERILEAVKDNVQFVNMSLLRDIADKFQHDIHQDGQLVFRFDHLLERCKEHGISAKTLDYIIMLLKSEGKANIIIDHNIKLVKFGSDFTELEIALERLESAKELVETDMKKCEFQMEALKDEAKACVKEKNMVKAKMLLKRKKRLEYQIEQKEGQLDNIETMFKNLSEADSQKMVVQAFKEGAEMLKMAQLKHDVDTTLSDFQDAIQDQNDIMKAMSTSLVSDTGDDDELEDELASLLADQDESEAITPTASSAGKAKVIPPQPSTQETELEELLDRLAKLRENDLPEVPEHDLSPKASKVSKQKQAQ